MKRGSSREKDMKEAISSQGMIISANLTKAPSSVFIDLFLSSGSNGEVLLVSE